MHLRIPLLAYIFPEADQVKQNYPDAEGMLHNPLGMSSCVYSFHVSINVVYIQEHKAFGGNNKACKGPNKAFVGFLSKTI